MLASHFEAARRWWMLSREQSDLTWHNNRGMDWGDWMSAGPATPKSWERRPSSRTQRIWSRAWPRHWVARQRQRSMVIFHGIRHAFVKNFVMPRALSAEFHRKDGHADVTSIVRALETMAPQFHRENDVLGAIQHSIRSRSSPNSPPEQQIG